MAETLNERLKRFTDEPATETLGWMNMMLQTYYVPELARVREHKLYHSVYLLAHSIIQTVSENMFSQSGPEGTRFFLAHFADGSTDDKKFSTISSEIHETRNLIAHRGYSKRQHEVQYVADDMEEGWRREEDGSLSINPVLYSIQVEGAFRQGKPYKTFCAQSELRLLQIKYRYIRQWLELDKDDAITKAIKALGHLDAASNLEAKDAEIRGQIYQRYGL